MLQLIGGCAGTGKSESLYRRMTQVIIDCPEQPCILLVPEQFSFVTERQLLRRLNPRQMKRVQVLSFSRLAERVQQQCGQLFGKPMSEAARLLLMSRAFEQTVDHLTFYRRHAGRASFLQTLLSAVSECRQCTITPDQLTTAAAALPKGTLQAKTQELALLMGAFEATAAPLYADPQEALTRLLEQLEQTRFFEGTAVFLDAFSGFTEQEYAVLGRILRHAEQVTVTLCTDTLRDDSGMSRFSMVMETAHRLTDLAAKNSVPVQKPLWLTEAFRFHKAELSALAAGALTPMPAVYEQPAEAVTITPCMDVYEESAYVARSIRRLLREGARARDIAVVARDLSPYEGVLDEALRRMDVPFYFDRRRSIVTDALPTVLLSALQCVRDGFQTESLLRLIKTGLLGFSPNSVAQLENYVYIWNLSGSAWMQEWTAFPDGFSAKEALAETERNRQLNRLEQLNRLRRRVMQPLIKLKTALSGKPDGQVLAHALYDYLVDSRANRLLRLQVRRLDAAGAVEEADRMARLWDVLVGLLDDVYLSLGDQPMELAHAMELLRMALSATDMGAIPQQMDATQVGSADRMRFSAPKIVFIMGANEGVFPQLTRSDSVFTDHERQKLKEQGLPLTDDSDGQTARERFFVYTALSAASDALYISYLCASGENGTLLPSVLPYTVRHILPGCRQGVARQPDGSDLETRAEAFERMAQARVSNPPLWAALHRELEKDPDYAPRIRVADRMAENRSIRFDDPCQAQRFWGNEMALSSTQIETYYQCRFAYFCRYQLRVKPRERAEMNALQFGNVLHAVMQNTLPAYVRQGMDTVERPQVFADAERAVTAYVQENMGGAEDKTAVFLYRLRSLARTCGELLWHTVEELRQSHFVPTDFELPIQKGDGLPPMTMLLPDGTQVYMQGKIDRVDVYEDNGTSYVRIVDYKTGQKEFHLSEVVQGLNLQMLIYLMTVWQNGGARYGAVMPAGMLYVPAKLPVLDRKSEQDKQPERAQKKLLRMNGLLLDDPHILQAMEADIGGVFLPVSVSPKGTVTGQKSLVSLQQLGKLKMRAEQLLEEMAQTLRQGDIDALPSVSKAGGKRQTACDYCAYADVCGHEEGDRERTLDTQADEMLLREKETDDGNDLADCGNLDHSVADGSADGAADGQAE